jgi:hypothetical protein
MRQLLSIFSMPRDAYLAPNRLEEVLLLIQYLGL